MEYFTTELDGVEVVIKNVPTHDVSTKGSFATRTAAPSAKQAFAKIEDVMDGMKPILNGMARRGADILSTELTPPDELTMCVGMGYSVEANMWVLGGKTEMTFEVEMKWKRKKKDADANEDAD